MRSEDTVFRATVVRRETVTPRMMRLTFADIAGTAGEVFEGSVLPDDFFSLYVPHGEGHAARYYTVRAWREEPGEMDVDVVLHDAGPATTWAAGVPVGADAHFDAPRGHYVVPDGAPRAIVAGDATALPAIGRIFDDRASEVPVLAIVAVEHEADRQDLALRDGDEVRWVTPAELVSHTLAAADDAAAGTYLWFSGEAADMRAVRKHVRHVLRWPNQRFMTMGYWRRDAEKWAARFEQQAGLQEQLEAIWESDEDSEEQRDRSDALLERHGL